MNNLIIASLHETAGIGRLTEILNKSREVGSIGFIQPLKYKSINKVTNNEV